MHYVYILASRRGEWNYIGSTNDLQRRLKEHNAGKVTSTAPHTPFRLVYYEAYAAEEDARHREHNLKLKSRAFAQLRRRLEKSLLGG